MTATVAPTTATTLATPDGPFTALVRDGAVLASGWTDEIADLVVLVHPTLRPAAVEPVPTTDGRVADVVAAVTAYYEGDLDAPARAPVHQASGEFRMHAWDVLRAVAPGEAITYTQYAARAGRPLAVRAAAGACAMNAAALFVPCHRIVRTDGSLGGFRYGLPIKRSLLDREARGATV